LHLCISQISYSCNTKIFYDQEIIKTLKKIKNIVFILAGLIIVFAIAWYSGMKYQLFQIKKTETSQIIVERIDKVLQLVTVESEFAEIYDYKDYRIYDTWPFSKKALVKVKAKASIGYNLEEISFHFDDSKHIVKLEKWPEPKLLSLDHDLEYYDMQEGLFNTFDSEDLTRVNQKAKEFIKDKVMSSDAYQAAEEQRAEFEALLRLSLGQTGWKLELPEPLLH